MRLVVLALACIALTSCWYGISLYSPSDAQPAIPAGVYLATAKDEPTKALRVLILANGLTQFDSGEKTETYGFAPLDRGGAAYVMWAPVKDDDPKASEPGEYQIYLLLVRQQDGEYRIYPPDCKDEEGEVARKNGAIIESGAPATCRFTNRTSLEAALRQLPRDEVSAATLKRIP